jgi:5-methylthioadenosine/S-adenosylhomocysteine deaminase
MAKPCYNPSNYQCKGEAMNAVDKILSNAQVVTMNEDFQIFTPGAVAIQGDEIAAVGPQDAILDSYSADEIIDCQAKTVIPGLVNGHTHVPMTLLRGLEDDRRLDVWLLGYVMPVEREFVSREFCKLGTKLACAEMIRSGITTFADMYFFEDAVAEATAEVGLRGILGQSVLKWPAPDADSYEDSLEAARTFIETWKDHPLIVPAIAPHAPYTTTPEILAKCVELAQTYDVPLHIHLAETEQEVKDWRDTHDMPVIPWVKKMGVLEAKVIAAHCVHVDSGEIHTLEHSGAGVAHNPSSNLKLASGFAPVTQMLEAGLNVAVGTDGTSSNNDLDMFEEIRLASFIAKGVTGDPTVLPARQVFNMATRMGAKAVHLDHLVGSLEPGKRADIVIVDLATLHNLPRFERDENSVYSRLIYAAKSTDVHDVMVNGRWLMRQQELITVEVAPLLEEASQYASKIDKFLAKREGSVLSKLIAIGGAEQQESYEVQMKVRLDDPAPVIERLNSDEVQVIRRAHYQEFDTYFIFEDESDGRLRYREDEFVDEQGEIYNVRYRLTLIGPAAEREFPNSVLLSRSRFIAPAQHSLRFYREYFEPDDELTINKDRLRWLISYGDFEFFINIDQIKEPALEGSFLEIKTRTWSRLDAERKAEMIPQVLENIGVQDAKIMREEYTDIVRE